MITWHNDENGHKFSIDGVRIPRTFTVRTDVFAMNRFNDLLVKNETELKLLVEEYQSKVEWNYKNIGKGKNWPIFNMVEKYLNKLQREAGIIDS